MTKPRAKVVDSRQAVNIVIDLCKFNPRATWEELVAKSNIATYEEILHKPR